MVSLRSFTTLEQEIINADIRQGGKDRSERPLFYTKFDGVKAYESGFSINEFLHLHPEKQKEINALIGNTNTTNLEKFKYLPIVGRIYWLAIYDETGKNIGYLESQD